MSRRDSTCEKASVSTSPGRRMVRRVGLLKPLADPCLPIRVPRLYLRSVPYTLVPRRHIARCY
eukprot:3556284-Pleurochrysis_carterae.AAC.1